MQAVAAHAEQPAVGTLHCGIRSIGRCRKGREALRHLLDRIAMAHPDLLAAGDAFDEAIASFGVAYADQTERDHAAFVAAVRSGRIPAEIGV